MLHKNQLDKPMPLYTLLGLLLLELGKRLLMVLVKPVLILRLVFPLMALQVLPRVLLLGKMVVLVLELLVLGKLDLHMDMLIVLLGMLLMALLLNHH